jgi:hypothetical protein
VGFAHVAEADDTESDDFHSGVEASGLVWRVKVEVGWSRACLKTRHALEAGSGVGLPVVEVEGA